jgi:hypothetical protein
MIKLESIETVRPSTYNPRQADPERLELIELSLRKLPPCHSSFSLPKPK